MARANRRRWQHSFVATLLATPAILGAQTASHDKVPAPPPSARLAELEATVQRLDSLSRQSPASVSLKFDAGGFTAQSADRRYLLRVRGYFQSDSRIPIGPGASALQRGLLLRRVRPIWEASLGSRVDVRLMPDFGEGRPTIYDAHFDLRLGNAVRIRSGKFKPPVGLERLQSATDIAFIERAHSTSLVPNRDVGTQLYGDLMNSGAVSYAIGVFNGVSDIGFGDVDTDRFKDVVGRIVFEPFKLRARPGADEFVLALSGSSGEHRGTPAASQLQTYRSPIQEGVFRFRSDGAVAGTVVADGAQRRLSPQAYAALGPLGLMAEFVSSTQRVRRGAEVALLRHRAWEVTGTWALTGEHESFRGLTPARPFDPAKGSWGAIELAARASALIVDPNSFPLFADPATQVARATTLGAGLNWHLFKGNRVMIDLTHTRFTGGASAGNRPTEHNLSTRFQHAF